MRFIALVIIISLSLTAYADNWAVLVSGSSGYWNYRHQADICHAYQVLIANGYNPDNIITFHFDDAAYAKKNPFPGTLYNKATGALPGVDVYKGCVIDYRGVDVTPQNFLSVLRGDSNAMGGRKVLQSTSADRVFINFVDHGSTGLIAFPKSYLYPKDLNPTFQYMFDNNMYLTLVFYLETCESGSMFQALNENLSIYALSAANPKQSSWGYYCPPNDKVAGKKIGSCLGDAFSINWLEDADSGNLFTRTLQDQFIAVRDLTKKSQVMQWGDLTYLDEPISNYLGAQAQVQPGFLSKLKSYLITDSKKESASWDSRDNKLLYLINQFAETKSSEDLVELEQEYYERQYFDQKFTQLKDNMQLTGTYMQSNDNSCLETQINNFESACMKLSDYGLKYVKYLAEMCDTSNILSVNMESQIQFVCQD